MFEMLRWQLHRDWKQLDLLDLLAFGVVGLLSFRLHAEPRDACSPQHLVLDLQPGHLGPGACRSDPCDHRQVTGIRRHCYLFQPHRRLLQ